MTVFGVTDKGFVKKTYSDILADLEAQAQGYFGSNVDLTATSPLYQFLCVVASEQAEMWDMAEAIYYQGYVNTATGSNLDALVFMLGFTRNPAVKATGSVTFSRSSAAAADITIPQGTVLVTTDGLTQFKTSAAATLLQNGTSVSVEVEAVAGGTSGNVPANAITIMVDVVSGVETVTNATETTGGANRETDNSLRNRVVNYAPGGKSTLFAIENAILAVTGVLDCLMSEDTTAHTITATVLGGDDAEVNAAIAATRPAGIPASLVRPTEISINVMTTVTKVTGAGSSTVQANVLAAIAAVFDAYTIGDDVTYTSFANAILRADGVSDITALSITDGTTTITALGQSISISATGVADPGSHSVTVN